jgi:hypothetical protein
MSSLLLSRLYQNDQKKRIIFTTIYLLVKKLSVLHFIQWSFCVKLKRSLIIGRDKGQEFEIVTCPLSIKKLDEK